MTVVVRRPSRSVYGRVMLLHCSSQARSPFGFLNAWITASVWPYGAQPSATFTSCAPGATPLNLPELPRLATAAPTTNDACEAAPTFRPTRFFTLSICTPKPTDSRTDVFGLSL